MSAVTAPPSKAMLNLLPSKSLDMAIPSYGSFRQRFVAAL
jgi:hypothetical protein